MDKLQQIREVLHYIDAHLADALDYERVAAAFHFS